MTTTHRGLTNHEIVESIERVYRHLKHLGFNEAESIRGAVALTVAFSGEFTREQAWEAADEIAAQLPQTTNPRGNDGQ